MLNRRSIDAVAAAAAGPHEVQAALRFVLLLAHPVDPRGRAHRRAESVDPAARRARRPRRRPAGHRRRPLRRRLRLALLRGVRGEHPGPCPLHSRRHGLQAHRPLSVHHRRARRLPALGPHPGRERDLRVVPVRARGRGDDRASPQLAGRREGTERARPRPRHPVRRGDPARAARRPGGRLVLGDSGRVHALAVQRRVHPGNRRRPLEGPRPRARYARGPCAGAFRTGSAAGSLLLRRHRPGRAPVGTGFSAVAAHRPAILRRARAPVLRGAGRWRRERTSGRGGRPAGRASSSPPTTG